MSYGDLRPMTWSEIVDRAFAVYRRNFGTFYLLQLGPQSVVWLLGLAFQQSFNKLTALGNNPSPSPDALIAAFASAVIPAMVIITIAVIVAAMQQASLTLAATHALLAEPITAGAAMSGAIYRMPAMIAAGIVSGLAQGAGLLCCCLPGIFLVLAFFVTVPAIIIEDCGPFRALSRSWELMMTGTPGTMHPLAKAGIIGLIVFAVGMAVGTLAGLPQLALSFGWGIRAASRGEEVDAMVFSSGLPFVLMALATGFQQVVASLVPPFTRIAAVLLFYDLKMRREGMDLLADDALAQPAEQA